MGCDLIDSYIQCIDQLICGLYPNQSLIGETRVENDTNLCAHVMLFALDVHHLRRISHTTARLQRDCITTTFLTSNRV